MIQLHGTRASPIPSFLYSEDELLCAASSWNFKRKTKTEGLVKTCPINNVSFEENSFKREVGEGYVKQKTLRDANSCLEAPSTQCKLSLCYLLLALFLCSTYTYFFYF